MSPCFILPHIFSPEFDLSDTSLPSSHKTLDSAKSLYHSATLEKLALLRLLKVRETVVSSQSARWDEALDALKRMTGDFERLRGRMDIDMESYGERMTGALERYGEAVERDGVGKVGAVS